ncbi:hypothetical protein BN135_926 [Cronobacter muytjensii 530]
MFIPLAGKDALAARGFKAATNAANTGEKIDKAKGVVRMMARRRGEQRQEAAVFAGAEALG